MGRMGKKTFLIDHSVALKKSSEDFAPFQAINKNQIKMIYQDNALENRKENKRLYSNIHHFNPMGVGERRVGSFK